MSYNIGSTKGYNSSFVALILQFGVVWSFFADLLFFGNVVDGMQMLGAVIIIVFNVVSIKLPSKEK